MGIFKWGSISLRFCKPIYNFFDLLISDDVFGVSILLIVPVGTRYRLPITLKILNLCNP